MTRKITIYAAAALTLVSICVPFIATTALAANPHEGSGFSTTTDACGGCHRTHVGSSGAYLLKGSTQLNLCNSCHDGSGADTNVVDGRYLGISQGINGTGLRGGGFTNAYMDTNIDGSLSSIAVSSKHTLGTGSPIAWGSGPLGDDDAGEAFLAPLECGNCHNPHGNNSYRLLRPEPTGLVDDATSANVTLPSAADNYTIAYDVNNYRDMSDYTPGVLSWMSNWCGQCHERYVAGSGAAVTARGDDVFTYSHMTDGLSGECLKCHVAHGTSATMTGNAGSPTITWPDQAQGYDPAWQGSEDNYSRLLTIDNRGVCMQCHDASYLGSN